MSAKAAAAAPAPTAKVRLTPSFPSSTITAFGDDVLREIFLRLRGTPCLVCAAMTCRRWLAVIRDGAFLRRFRRLHPLPAVDFVLTSSLSSPHLPLFAPVYRWPPRPTEGNAFAMRHLPEGSWFLSDVAGGRVLLQRQLQDHTVVSGFAICDPLSLRYTLIPPPPEDLHQGSGYAVFLGAALLVNAGADEPFRVLCAFHDGTHPVACAFSSDEGEWHPVNRDMHIWLPPNNSIFVSVRAGSWMFWKMELEDRLLSLDLNTFQFSMIGLPNGMAASHFWSMHVMLTEEDDICIVALAGLVLRFWFRAIGPFGQLEWVIEKEVPISQALAQVTGDDRFRRNNPFRQVSLIGAHAGFVLLKAWNHWVFALRVKTLQLEKVGRLESLTPPAYPFSMASLPSFLTTADNAGEDDN